MIFENPKTRGFIFTNYKVMFSTLSMTSSLSSRSHGRSTGKRTFFRLLCRHLGLGPDTYVLVRNPYSRIVSFFVDKFRKQPRRFQTRLISSAPILQPCQQLFFPDLGLDETATNDDISERLLSYTFSKMVDYLPNVYDKDGHLRPQYEVEAVRWRSVSQRVSFDRVIPVEQMDPAFMRTRLGIDIRDRRNTTDRDAYPSFLSPKSLGILNNLYAEDFARFGYEVHDRVPDRAVQAPVHHSLSS